MTWKITWQDKGGKYGAVTTSTVEETETLASALVVYGVIRVVVYDLNAEPADLTREQKGCTHPASEPCFPIDRALSDAARHGGQG